MPVSMWTTPQLVVMLGMLYRELSQRLSVNIGPISAQWQWDSRQWDDLASMTNEIQKSLSSLETTMKEGLERKRPLEGPPPSEAKKVKFQHPVTKEEHIGTEKECDQKMAQWWGEIAASSAASGINPAGQIQHLQRNQSLRYQLQTLKTNGSLAPKPPRIAQGECL